MITVRAIMLVLVFALSACASSPERIVPAATSRDISNDRILVTLASRAPPGAARLSISGRLDYVPPSFREARQEQLEAAEQLAELNEISLEEEWPIPALDVHCFVFRVADASRRSDVITQLAARPEVESVQPLNFFHGEAVATSENGQSDPLADWDRGQHERLRAAHARATGRNVEVAVIDAGADLAHEDLAGQSVRGVDLVDGRETIPAEMHGTAIVGLIAARPENGIGIRGYAPEADILLLRACWEADGHDTAVCNSFTLARALSHALASGADVVNMSISGPRDPLLERLGAALAREDVLLVAAGRDRETFPASIPGSILAAHFIEDDTAMTLAPGNRYAMRHGTSILSAKVAAAAALYREGEPDLDASAFNALLTGNASASGFIRATVSAEN